MSQFYTQVPKAVEKARAELHPFLGIAFGNGDNGSFTQAEVVVVKVELPHGSHIDALEFSVSKASPHIDACTQRNTALAQVAKPVSKS